ncbi:MAG: hypothetical protein ACJ763_14050 [Bdellovibrionia bacterium]
MWAKLKSLDRRLVMGVMFLLVIGGLIYFSGKAQHEVAIEIKPLTVHLRFSDAVKRHLAETGAVLGVQAIVSDKEVASSPLDATVLDHREQVVKPGDDTARFETKTLDLEMPGSSAHIDPTITLSVVTRLDHPAGNCIHCESPMLKASSLKEGDNSIELKCDGWLEMGVCVWPKQNQK